MNTTPESRSLSFREPCPTTQFLHLAQYESWGTQVSTEPTMPYPALPDRCDKPTQSHTANFLCGRPQATTSPS